MRGRRFAGGPLVGHPGPFRRRQSAGAGPGQQRASAPLRACRHRSTGTLASVRGVAGKERPMHLARIVAVGVSAALALPAAPAHAAAALPGYDHIVVVVEENHAFGKVIGNARAPYLSSLAAAGATMSRSFAVTHPSEPNYLALFSGSTQGVADDSCPHTFSTENLGHQLIAAKKTFIGYSEGLPSTGSAVCTLGEYACKHAPWTDFSNVPSSDSVP